MRKLDPARVFALAALAALGAACGGGDDTADHALDAELYPGKAIYEVDFDGL